ncbi:ABC transporter substrate-binding protein [Vagococcus elongatus]|uniref:SsuA/THI5-like domain-containing protein n=1 Tax=Vagococcus elongatus TaxID=180344 RepID=A0A430AHU8_9ENTE|nr:ABC transporter substrate-binding protein [Vagococcus elongatus]RSU07650.1 hypothetical protein CBF29_13230 [Vagococcus elongatus]
MKKRSFRKIWMVAMSVLLIFMATGCGKNNEKEEKKVTTSSGEELPVLRVAIMPFVTSLPTEYIVENNLDEKAGFKIETIMFSTGAPMNEALAADEWDVGAMGAAAVTGVANYDMMIIGEVLESTDGLAVFTKPDSKMAKVKGTNPSFPSVLGDADSVKGTTISLPVGTAQHFTTLKWLEKIGLEGTDVNIVNMETAQAYQALQAGEADATALNVPTFFEAEKDGMVQVGNLADLGTRYVDMVVANRKAVEKKEELLQKYISVLFEANAALEADKEAAAELMHQWLTDVGAETSLENCKSDLERVFFISKEDMGERTIGTFAKELGEFYVDQGQLEPDVIDKLDNNVIDKFTK